MRAKSRIVMLVIGVVAVVAGIGTALSSVQRSALGIGGWTDWAWILITLAIGAWVLREPRQAPVLVGLIAVNGFGALDSLSLTQSIAPVVLLLDGVFLVLASVLAARAERTCLTRASS